MSTENHNKKKEENCNGLNEGFEGTTGFYCILD